MWPATSLGFVSRSSLGTLPMTQTVTGQSLVGVIVAKRENILDQDAYDAARRTSFQAIQNERPVKADAAADADARIEASAETALARR